MDLQTKIENKIKEYEERFKEAQKAQEYASVMITGEILLVLKELLQK